MRKKPYTEIGIRRMNCFRCGSKPTQQWQICADGNVYRPICKKCDILLNELVLRFIGFPNWEKKMQEYVKKITNFKK